MAALIAKAKQMGPRFRFVADFFVGLRRDLFDHYRPEKHYMRGPGPKWREKHGRPGGR